MFRLNKDNMNYDNLTDLEKDTKLNILSTWVNLPHGDLAKTWKEFSDSAKRDPELFAHFVSYYFNHGRVRDHKVSGVAALFCGEQEYRFVGAGGLSRLAPFEVVNLDRFMRGTLKREPASYQRSLRRYVYNLFDNEGRALGLIARSSKTADYLVRRLHPKLSDAVKAAMGFGGEVKVDTLPWAIKQLALVSGQEKADLITRFKIPFTTAVGALGSDGMTPEALRAIVGVMSPQEAINMASRLDGYGVNSDPIAARLFATKIAQAANTAGVNLAKMSVANKASTSKITKDMLDAAQSKGITNAARKVENRKPVNVLFAGDKSGSMTISIGVMAQAMAMAKAALPDSTFYAYVFDTFAREAVLTNPLSHESNLRDLNKVKGGGGTACGSPLVVASEKGQRVDIAIYSTDGGDNSSPMIGDGIKTYERKMGYKPEIVIVGVGNYDTAMEWGCKDAAVNPTVIRWSGDYNGINNLIMAVAPGSRYALLENVYNTELMREEY